MMSQFSFVLKIVDPFSLKIVHAKALSGGINRWYGSWQAFGILMLRRQIPIGVLALMLGLEMTTVERVMEWCPADVRDLQRPGNTTPEYRVQEFHQELAH